MSNKNIKILREFNKKLKSTDDIYITSFNILGKTYEIKDGDYILFNGSSLMFCSGDSRIIYFGKNFNHLNYVYIGLKEFKKLGNKNIKKVIKHQDGGFKIILKL
jgi:hypothetical protein